jgi:hypothetical protein
MASKPKPQASKPKPAPVKPQESRAVSTIKPTSLSAALLKRASNDTGKGVSTLQEDNLIPLVYVLQPLSPQALKKTEKYIEGAEAGDIWLRNAADPIVKGDDGMVFQPCYFNKDWVEWMPDRGGFVGRHLDRPDEAVQEDVEGDDGQTRQVWRLPNGNQVVETRYHIGFVLRDGEPPLPYTIPLSSTGHSVSKAWMFAMNSEQLPDGGTMPPWMVLYRLTTKMRTKNDKNWFQLEVTKEGYISTEEEYERGLALHDAFASGAKKVADDETTTDTAEDDIAK